MGSRISVVDVAANSTTVYTGPCLLHGIYVDAALSAHACPVVDNATTKFSLVASLAAGTSLQFPGGILFETSLVIDPNDAATGTIAVFYQPLDQALR